MTLKSEYHDIEDWVLLFDAVMRQKPEAIPTESTIEHAFAIRDVAANKLKKLSDDMIKCSYNNTINKIRALK